MSPRELHLNFLVCPGGADGFNVMPPGLPGGFDLFADEVVPILRARGLFLRDHYGLARPESQYAA